MKLPRPLTQRPTPQMPQLVGFEPCFDAIPGRRIHQPAEPVRPVYWWAKALQERGDLLWGLGFDAACLRSSVTVRLASYRVVQVVRSHDDRPRIPDDLPGLLAEALWRLGALGWADQLEAVVDLLCVDGLVASPLPIRASTKPIPGWLWQPDSCVRVAYWWAAVLLQHGWRLHGCGDSISRHGFIAEIPSAAGEPLLVVYPGDVAADGTEASALARQLGRLDASQRRRVQQFLAAAAAGQGRVV